MTYTYTDEQGEHELDVDFRYIPHRHSNDYYQPDDPEEAEILSVRLNGAEVDWDKLPENVQEEIEAQACEEGREQYFEGCDPDDALDLKRDREEERNAN